MTHDDLLFELGRMAPETEPLHCLGCKHEQGCSVHGCAIVKAAIREIKLLDAKNAALLERIWLLEQKSLLSSLPLTPDELLEMNGKPVWVRSLMGDDFSYWAIVSVKTYRAAGLDFSEDFEDYGTGWLAYRRKPEEVDKS